MNFIVIIPLLLLGTSVVLGHSIKKLEVNNKADAEVYEIKEDAATNTVAFANPKADKPTLREIVYYHMVERPYGTEEGRVRYDSEDSPEIDETMRPFTNSHGFPFLESVEKELDNEHEKEVKEDSSEAKKEIVIEEIPKEGAEYEVMYEVMYDEVFPINDDKTTKQEKSKEHIVSTVTSEILEEISTEANIDETMKTVTKKTDTEIVMQDTNSDQETTTRAITVTEATTTDPVTEEPIFEKNAKSARKLLFDRVKERYYTKTNVTQNSPSTSERRKRETKMHIPEAPKLGKLNFDSLPPYLRRLISTEPKTRIISDSEWTDEEIKLDDIKHRMHELMSTLKTPDSLEEVENKPRTYGMNLTADNGYVWNDMVEPGVHYNVEATESIEEDVKVSPAEKHKKDSKYNHEQHDYEVISESMEDSKNNNFEEMGRKSNKHKEKDDTISQLMESDQFWKWLADWTSVYMDVLADHIKEAVHQEVEDQIKIQEERERDNKESEHTEILEPEDEDSAKNAVENTTPEPVRENEKSDSDNKDEESDADKTDEKLKKRKEKEDKEKKDVTPINKDDEPIKNGNKEKTAKVEAQNVYGNTIGGEKVTNIFIFYPNQDPDKVIQDIAKLNDTSNVNIDIRLNVPDKDMKDKIKKKDESVEKNKDVSIDDTTKEESTGTPVDIKEKPTNELALEMQTTNALEATTVEQPETTTEIEPTTESSKVESTTELKLEENVPKDKTDNDETEKEIIENKTVESKIDNNSKPDATENKSETTTEKDDIKEKIVSTTESSTDESKS